jgi:DNA-directed RNA polymerase specialized sigma24 family protein
MSSTNELAQRAPRAFEGPRGCRRPGTAGAFPATDRALLNGAQHHDRKALAHLCAAYWYPVYAYLRRKGASPEDAKDLTQDLFARLLVCERFAETDFSGKRFRAWLCLTAKNQFLNACAGRAALKNGGGQQRLTWDAVRAETRFSREAMHLATPEQLFDRCWARTVAARAFAKFKQQVSCPEDVELTLELCAEIAGQRDQPSLRSHVPRSDVERQARCRKRKRLLDEYRRCVRREVRLTVQHPSEVDDELRVLSDLLP